MAYIRANPLHFLAQKPLGAQMPQVAPAGGAIKPSASGPLFAHLGHFAHPVNLARGHNSNGHWIAKATKNSHGQFRAKAKKAGMSTAAYARKEASAPGKTGKQARLDKTLMGLH